MWQDDVKIGDKVIVKRIDEFGIFLRDCRHSFKFPIYHIHKIIRINNNEIITFDLGVLGGTIEENKIGLEYTFNKTNRNIKITKFLYYTEARDMVFLKYTNKNIENFTKSNENYWIKKKALSALSSENAEKITKIIGYNMINYKKERQNILLKIWEINDVEKLEKIVLSNI